MKAVGLIILRIKLRKVYGTRQNSCFPWTSQENYVTASVVVSYFQIDRELFFCGLLY